MAALPSSAGNLGNLSNIGDMAKRRGSRRLSDFLATIRSGFGPGISGAGVLPDRRSAGWVWGRSGPG